MDHAAVRQDGHRPDHFRDEAVDLGRRHQPGKVPLGLQERLPAVGHQVIHVEGGLHRHRLQRLTEFLPLALVLGELPGNRLLGAGFDVRVGEQARQVADVLVRFRDLALEPHRFGAVRLQRLARHRRDFVQHAVHVVKHGAHRRLDAGHELVLADRRLVVACLRPVRLPPATGVVAIGAFAIAALARVVDAAAAGTEQVTGKGPHFRSLPGTIDAVRSELRLGALECLIVDDPQRLVAVHDVAALIGPPRHAVPRGPVELEAAPQVADFPDQHPVREDATDRPESPRPAEPRRNAALPHPARDFLEPDRLRQVGLEDEADCFRFLFMDGEPLLSIGCLQDAIAVGRRPACPAAFLVPLHEPLAGPLRQHAAVVGGDHKLDTAGERIRPFGDAHDLDAMLLQILDKHVRLSRPAEPVIFVDVEPVDAARFGLLHEAEQFRPAARRAAGFRLVDEVLEGFARSTLAGLDLYGDGRAFVLGVT